MSDPDIKALDSDKQFSIHVSRTLDCLGKNQDMVKYRVKMYREMQRYWNIIRPTTEPVKLIVAGSKAEGLTSLCESDHDLMSVLPDVLCVNNSQEIIYSRYNKIFETERGDTAAGYTKLKLVKCDGEYLRPLILESLFQNASGDRYLSSDFILTNIASQLGFIDVNHHERSGPSLPMSNKKGNMHYDAVLAFRCVCPDLLQSFITRPRFYDRPNRTTLNYISKSESHVVAVGNKGSNTSYQEWRICFTEAEIYLVQRFNDTETKLYILLKMISKLLKVISRDITSYVMKNIVLWLVELYPVSMFEEELLTTQLLLALMFLKQCVEANFLPSYMIPARNLIAGRLNREQSCKLITFLSTLIHEGGCLLLRCEKLPIAMMKLFSEPDLAVEFKLKRDTVDKLRLIKELIQLEKQATLGLSEDRVKPLLKTDRTYLSIHIAWSKLIMPDMLLLYLQGYSPEAVSALFSERLIQFLSGNTGHFDEKLVEYAKIRNIELHSDAIERFNKKKRPIPHVKCKVIDKFTNSKARQPFYEARKDLGVGKFAKENLTSLQKKLRFEARQLKRYGYLSNTWVEGCKIKARLPGHDGKVITIRDMIDIRCLNDLSPLPEYD